ncbi:MAG: hypothetical protein WAQ08_16135 [Aquabacterium sp.]|uniref:hypothetical protein n=1 Tax=Aquabacterium sp. TaxID=1872578 RepID=UPI003BAEFB44
MPRTNPTLLQNANVPSKGDWRPTEGFIRSVDACLVDGATSAVVDFYGSNAGHGIGTKIATVTLSLTTPADGTTFATEDQGWFFVRAELASNAGALRSATACVGA